MNTKNQLLCTWAGPAFLTIFSIGWWFIAWFIPPQSPNSSAAEIAAFYMQNPVSIKMGMVIAMFSVGFFGPWLAVISTQMQRMEGRSPVLAYTQMICGAMGVLAFLLPIMIWCTIAFRPERDPQLMLLFNDLAWLMLTTIVSPGIVQNIAIGVAILGDKNPIRVFPKWAAYFNFWIATSFMPALIVPFFKTGPFAWDGIIGFWVPLVNFGAWVWVMFFLLRKGIKQQAAEAA